MTKLKLFLILLFINVSTTLSYSQISDFKEINFNKADKIAEHLKGANLYDLPQLSHKLTKDLTTDVEKFRAIYIWVTSNIENDFSLYLKNKVNRYKLKNDSVQLVKFNREISTVTFKKLLKEKKTVCTGYAYLIKELSNLSNIQCEIINGYGRTVESDFNKNPVPNHSWNAVQLNSKWYLCDSTWSSGFFDPEKNSFVKSYNDGYFLTYPAFFLLNHFPLEEKWLLVSNKITIEKFNNLPKIYPETFKNDVMILDPLNLNLNIQKGETISFKLSTTKPIDVNKINIELVSGNYSSTIFPNIKEIKKNQIEISFEILEKGIFDIHIKLNQDYLYTFVVNVKKQKQL